MNDNLFSNVNNNQGGEGVGQLNDNNSGVVNPQPVVDNQVNANAVVQPVTEPVIQQNTDLGGNNNVTLGQAISNIGQPVEPVNAAVNNTTPVQPAPLENTVVEPSGVVTAQISGSQDAVVGNSVSQVTDNVSNNQVDPVVEPTNKNINPGQSVSQDIKKNNGNESNLRVISPFTYFAYNILFAIPVIGLILLIVKAFDKKDINIRNYARSFFINIIFIIVIGGVLVFGGLVNIGTLINANSNTTNENNSIVDDNIVDIDEDVTVDNDTLEDTTEQGEVVTNDEVSDDVNVGSTDEVVENTTTEDNINE